jgi:hypothetical protein
MAERRKTPRLPDFNHKMYQMATEYTKWPQNIPNGHIIYQIAKNKPNSKKIISKLYIHSSWCVHMRVTKIVILLHKCIVTWLSLCRLKGRCSSFEYKMNYVHTCTCMYVKEITRYIRRKWARFATGRNHCRHGAEKGENLSLGVVLHIPPAESNTCKVLQHGAPDDTTHVVQLQVSIRFARLSLIQYTKTGDNIPNYH